MRLWLIPLLALLAIGCSKSDLPGHDLSMVESKAKVGMNEFDLTTQVGTPNHIDIDGDERKLRYDASDGKGSVVVTLKQNVVVDISRKE
jgi:hypothetical protein